MVVNDEEVFKSEVEEVSPTKPASDNSKANVEAIEINDSDDSVADIKSPKLRIVAERIQKNHPAKTLSEIHLLERMS